MDPVSSVATSRIDEVYDEVFFFLSSFSSLADGKIDGETIKDFPPIRSALDHRRGGVMREWCCSNG